MSSPHFGPSMLYSMGFYSQLCYYCRETVCYWLEYKNVKKESSTTCLDLYLFSLFCDGGFKFVYIYTVYTVYIYIYVCMWDGKQKKTNPQAFMACRAPSFLAIGMTNMTRIVLVSEFVLSTLIILICYSHQCRHVQLNMKDISQSVGSTEWTLNGRERQREVQGDCFLDHWGPCELLSKTQLTEIKPVTAYCSIQRHNCVQSAGERGTGRGAFGRLRRTREGGEPLLPATDLLFLLSLSLCCHPLIDPGVL